MITADKRTPHTDALETLGLIHQYDEKRDAIHLGVEPVEAGERLRPGEHIGLINGKAYNAKDFTPPLKALGIVDPFLETSVLPGQRFWLVVYPRKITSLRHVWEHPDFIQTGPSEEIRLRPLTNPAIPNFRETTTAHINMPNSQKCLSTVAAEERIREIADGLEVDVEWLMDNADEAQREEWHYVTHPDDSGAFEGVSLPDDFWANYAVVRDIPEPENKHFFTCSC